MPQDASRGTLRVSIGVPLQSPAQNQPGNQQAAGLWTWEALALLGLWLAIAALVDPRGDFPLGDDWSYARPVQSLVEQGRLRFTEWTSMTLLAQVYWGALFCLPAGFSFTALRISTLVLGYLGIWATWALLREFRWSRRAALLGGDTRHSSGMKQVINGPTNACIVYVNIG